MEGNCDKMYGTCTILLIKVHDKINYNNNKYCGELIWRFN